MGRPRVAGSARKKRFAPLAVLVGTCVALGTSALPAAASIHHRHWQRWQTAHTALKLTDPEKDAALVLDGESGKVLYARNADALRHPASLTKMMTLYLLFEQLKNGQMTLATPLYVSQHAAMQARTKLYLRPGNTIPVDTAIKAVVVLSANDVAVTIAEAIGGTESRFAQMMTAKARALGMKNTFYDNASGLPDPLQITTASDLAMLARHLAYDFPQYFHYFSTYSFSYRGATILTHDNLIGKYDGADGIKTGYTNASGFNLVSSVVRNGMHIIGVVMGGTTARRRDAEMIRLLDDTFAAIGRDPMLVARAEVPWQAIAQNGQTRPVIAGFQFGTGVTSLPTIQQPQQPRSAAPPVDAARDDEDAAESRPDPLLDSTIVASPSAAPLAPQPRTSLPVLQKAPLAVPPKENNAPSVLASVPLPTLTRRDAVAAAPPPKAPLPVPPKESKAPTVLASVPLPTLTPHDAVASAPPPSAPSLPAISLGSVPLPSPKPHLSVADYQPEPIVVVARAPAPKAAQAGPADNYWTVQIGAFADAALARAKLAAYAERSGDILGQASHIVAPFQSTDGHTLYRARFGPFAERDARQVCEALTKRGENCFAAVAAR